MAKKVIYNTKNLEITAINRFSELVRAASARELENELRAITQTEILPLIDKGLSPVKGYRAFQKYKDPKKYPGDRKPSNKPNLRLTGEMLKEYIARAHNRGGLNGTIGIHSDAAHRSKMLAGVHNNGDNEHVPIRRFIPDQKAGELYTAKIMAAIRKAFGYVLGRAIKQGRGQK